MLGLPCDMHASLLVARGGYSLVAVHRLLIVMASHAETMALVVLCHVEPAQSQDKTRVPCIGRQIPNH